MKINYLLSMSMILFLFFIVSCSSGESAPDAQNNTIAESDALSDSDIVQSEDEEIPVDSENSENESVLDSDEEIISDNDKLISFAEPADFGDPEALIVTNDELKDAFKKLAVIHTLTGIYTEVVTVSEICAQSNCTEDPKTDIPAAIKSFAQKQTGLKYLILGGDIEIVPSRKLHDKYKNLVAGTFEEDFYTDYYFADFADWDSNKNGIYAEDEDSGIDFRPEIAVGRIPVSLSSEPGIEPDVEALIYIDKVISYMTNYNTADMLKSAFLANVATKFQGISVNAGFYFETEGRTISLFPESFKKRRLYAESTPAPVPDAEKLSVELHKDVFKQGTNIIVHNGHGYPSALSLEQGDKERVSWFYGTEAYKLENTTYPIYLSCACQAAQFEAPFIWHTIYQEKEYNVEFKEDAAGELLVNAPLGGAIAYLGNSTTGLGLAGGSQFIDKMIEYFFANDAPILADAIKYAHEKLPEQDSFKPPIIGINIPVVDPDSYRWTQKSVTMLGDILIPVYNKEIPKGETPLITKETVDGGIMITISLNSQQNLKLFADGKYYIPENIGNNLFVFKIKGVLSKIFVGYTSEFNQSYFAPVE